MLRLAALLVVAGIVSAQTPSRSEQDAALAAIREYARHYTEGLPNYTATQSIRRDVRPVRRGLFLPSVRSQTDVVEEELTYSDSRESHKTLRVNGQPVKEADTAASAGLFSSGEFGGLVASIFDPASGTTFRWDRLATLNGRRVFVFNFRVPARPAGYGIEESGRTNPVAYEGSVFADAQTHAVMRIRMNCVDIPSSSAYLDVRLTLDYAAAQVAGQEFIRPAQYTLNAHRGDSSVTLEASYSQYRRFGADTSIVFEEERP